MKTHIECSGGSETQKEETKGSFTEETQRHCGEIHGNVIEERNGALTLAIAHI